jgi:hypothetical protein
MIYSLFIVDWLIDYIEASAYDVARAEKGEGGT